MKLTAMADTTVRINDTVRIHSVVSNVYSKVALYKWNCGVDGKWDDSLATSDTIVSRPHVFTHVATDSVVVYARDDSGMVKIDAAIVTVTNAAPIITSTRADTTISIKDSIAFLRRHMTLTGP